jgi:hypothetical protein
MGRTWLAGLGALALASAAGEPALAQSDIFSPATFHGLAEARIAAADGERSWIEGGFGKTAISGEHDDWQVEPALSQAVLEWRPRLNFAAGRPAAPRLG